MRSPRRLAAADPGAAAGGGCHPTPRRLRSLSPRRKTALSPQRKMALSRWRPANRDADHSARAPQDHAANPSAEASAATDGRRERSPFAAATPQRRLRTGAKRRRSRPRRSGAIAAAAPIAADPIGSAAEGAAHMKLWQKGARHPTGCVVSGSAARAGVPRRRPPRHRFRCRSHERCRREHACGHARGNGRGAPGDATWPHTATVKRYPRNRSS